MNHMENNYDGSPVIIYNSDGEYIANATINEHNIEDMTISISDRLDSAPDGTEISVLIINPDEIFEFFATVESWRDGVREISLYEQRKRAMRASPRRKVNTPASIRGAFVGTEYHAFSTPLAVMVDNISSTGALIKTPIEHFSVGHVIEIILNLDGMDSFLYGEVVRVVKTDDNSWAFGIAFSNQNEIS